MMGNNERRVQLPSAEGVNIAEIVSNKKHEMVPKLLKMYRS